VTLASARAGDRVEASTLDLVSALATTDFVSTISSMHATFPNKVGDPIEFDYDGAIVSAWINQEILDGKTYPHLPFIGDVQTIFDVGANCGAASVYFARLFPQAQIHAFEPGADALSYLTINAARHANIPVHGIGLYSADTEMLLYQTEGATVMGSIHPHGANDQSERIQLRAADQWAIDHEISRIDVLKVDVEGAEVEVLTSLSALLPTVKVLYLEYHSRQIRRTVEAILAPSHELYSAGWMALDQGECIYVRSDLCDGAAAADWLDELYRERLSD
jgi:FkbM family methyltransferase